MQEEKYFRQYMLHVHLGKDVREAYIAAIEEQAVLGIKPNTWCSLVELAGLATVTRWPVQ